MRRLPVYFSVRIEPGCDIVGPKPMSSVERPVTKPRPVYLSLLHRISGAGLFLVGLPLLLVSMQWSLASPESFEALRATLANPLAKIVLIGLIWAYVHHFCAGIRYLLLDIHQFIDLKPTRQSSAVVLVVSLGLTLIIGALLW